jgi:hypothetical protein
LSKNAPIIKRSFSTTTYAAIPYLGTLLWKAVQFAAAQLVDRRTRPVCGAQNMCRKIFA